MLPGTHRIPLEAAQTILATFGITRPTKAYERWVKTDGFDVRDFNSVLFESKFIFVVDWRASLDEELANVASTLSELGVQLQCDLDEEGEAGYVACEGRRTPVKYRPNDEDRLDEVFCAIQSVVPKHIEFRGSPLSEGSDTALFAVLPRDEWADLKTAAADVIAHFFKPLVCFGS